MSDFYFPVGPQQPISPNLEYYSKQQTPYAHDYGCASFDVDTSTSQDTFNVDTSTSQAFEEELDLLFSQGILDVTTVPTTDNSAIFERIRTGTPTRGVPSTFTVSSESASAYDSVYNETESVYTHYSDLSALHEQFTMNFQSLGVADSDASVYSAQSPISPHGSPASNMGISVASFSPTAFSHRGSFSDYEPTRIRVPPSSASDYYPQMSVPIKYSSHAMQGTVSPANVSSQLPSNQSLQGSIVASQREQKHDNMSRVPSSKDSKRKYQCPSCPRAFARAFNLKTHVQTHDPNRSKPYACQHKSCGRAFSRKHDLTRHLISIHRSDVDPVGVAGGARSRCEDCGASAGSNGKMKCDCQNNVK
ncbi:hypothetical protein BDW22DRAFT_1327651 [Trametopsis cervina]|nr:hypothetical protein BDW22DRAFT_1327651 [Trametopsis cervina]